MTDFELIKQLEKKKGKKATNNRAPSSITDSIKSEIKQKISKNINKLRVTLNSGDFKSTKDALIELAACNLAICNELGIQYHKEIQEWYKVQVKELEAKKKESATKSKKKDK